MSCQLSLVWWDPDIDFLITHVERDVSVAFDMDIHSC